MASKLCDSCKSATATLFCRADSAFLCVSCDSKVHAANKLASRHARVWVCEVCEQAPAHVTCKADAAALCVTCDRDIHSANPLAQRHERVAVTPFYDSAGGKAAVKHLDERYLSEVEGEGGDEEEEAASWLVGNPGKLKTGQYGFEEMESYLDLDLDYGSVDPKLEPHEHNNSSATDGVVPHPPIANQQFFQLDFTSSKPYGYGFPAPSFTQTVSSSSMEVGVVPDGSAMTEISNPYSGTGSDAVNQTVPLSAVDREARVLRYREKRKNRKFEKTIRYASRKAYAETRPRIKGRFAKRTDIDVEADPNSVYGFRVVPSF